MPQNKTFYNVVTILVSSVSKEHFIRMMPNTISYLEQLQSKGPSQVFIYKNYNVIGLDSISNQVPLWSGYNVTKINNNELSELQSSWLWSKARANGYVTLFTEETCNLENSVRKFFPEHLVDKDKWKIHFDHTFVDFFCDSKFKNHEDEGPIWKHGPSCVGGK